MRPLDWVLFAWIASLQLSYALLAWQHRKTTKLLIKLIETLGRLRVS